MCNPAPISQNGHKVWEKAAAGKNPKPGEIQHPVRGSGGGQGQRIDFTSEQAARGSAARAPNMNGGRDEIALFISSRRDLLQKLVSSLFQKMVFQSARKLDFFPGKEVDLS